MRYSFSSASAREARLLRFAGAAPEPSEVPTPDIGHETQAETETTIPETPEDMESAVTEATDTAQTDVDHLDAGSPDAVATEAGVDTAAIESDTDVADAAAAVQTAAAEEAVYPELANTPGYDEQGHMVSAPVLETRTEGATTEESAATEDAEADAHAQNESQPPTPENEASDAATERKEETETPEQRFDRAKDEQRLTREQEKYQEAGTSWSTIESGKTDGPQGTGEPFVYKQETALVNGVSTPLLLAFSPKTGLQIMDTQSGEWKYVRNMPPEDQGTFTAIEKDIAATRDGVLVGEQDDASYYTRAERNQRNHDVEEGALKNKEMTPDRFREKQGDADFWVNNEGIRDGLAAALEPKTESAGGEQVADTSETHARGVDTTEEEPVAEAEVPTEEEPVAEAEEPTEEEPVAEAEEPTEEEPVAEAEEPTEEEQKGPSEEDIAAAEGVIENADASSAERTEAIKTLTEAMLAELGESTTEEPSEEEKPATEQSDVKAVEKLEERNETDKELRTRIMVEARNAKPDMKTGEDLKSEKQEAFDTWKEGYDVKLADADTAVTGQRTKVDALKNQVFGLESAAGPDAEGLSELKEALATEEATLQTLEQNVQTLKDNATVKEAELKKDLDMIDTLTDEADKLSDRTDKKLQEMGDKLVDLGETDMATIARNIIVKHDGSFGMEMSGVDGRLSDKIDAFIEDNDKAQLEKNDNPVPALRGIAGYLKNVEAREAK